MKRVIEYYPTALETSSIVPTKITETFPQAPERFLYNLAFPMAYMALSAADHNATKKLVVSADKFCFAHSADKPRKTITLRTYTARWFRKCERQQTRGNGSGLDCGEIAPGVKLEFGCTGSYASGSSEAIRTAPALPAPVPPATAADGTIHAAQTVRRMDSGNIGSEII